MTEKTCLRKNRKGVIDSKYASFFQGVLVQRISGQKNVIKKKSGFFCFKLKDILSCLYISWNYQIQGNTLSHTHTQ